jgi:ribonuclease BN (tRNA processing enzyme)
VIKTVKVTVVGFWGGFPGANEATSGYLIEHNGYHLLVDCGSGVLSKLQNYLEIEDLDALILSHYHQDHIADVGSVQYGRLINTYIGKEVEELPIYGHSFDLKHFLELSMENVSKGISYDPNGELRAGPFIITFMKTKHPVTCFAMRIEAAGDVVVYTADSSYLAKFIEFCKDANLLICESSFYEGQDGVNAGHMTSVQAGLLAEDANVQTLLLTHLPHFGNHQDLVKQAKKRYNGVVVLATSGFIWES